MTTMYVVFMVTACSNSASEDTRAPVDSIPFAGDDLVDSEALDNDLVDPDADLTEDIDDLPLDVAPDEPVTDDVAAALTDISADDSATSPVEIGAPVPDPTHVGTTAVTVEALMRELSVAYAGTGELIGEVHRTAGGGTFTFSLTGGTTSDLVGAHLVTVGFSTVDDPDQPSMIVGHRAETITLAKYELATG